MTEFIEYPPGTLHRRLTDWGRSGSFAPYMEPDKQSTDALRLLQDDILCAFPDAIATQQLHATIFFCPPEYLFNFIKQHIKPEASHEDEVMLYMDIFNTLQTCLMMSVDTTDVATEKLEVFGVKRDVVALKLARTASLAVWRSQVRELFVRNLREFGGFTDQSFETMRKDPKLMWLIEDSASHITLASIPEGEITIQNNHFVIPDTITIGSIHTGNSGFLQNPLSIGSEWSFGESDDE